MRRRSEPGIPALACIALVACAEPEPPRATAAAAAAESSRADGTEPVDVAAAERLPLFLELDADENGRITNEEAAAVPQLAASFDTLDKDGSGGIDPIEYIDARETGSNLDE